VSETTRIVEIAELDFDLEPGRWGFAKARAAEIAAHWTKLRETKPALYNGRVLLLGRSELVRDAEAACD